MDNQNCPQISVLDPIGAAIEKTSTILFKPFDFAKWFTISFCAWLVMLSQSSLNLSSLFGHLNREDISPERVQEFVLSHLMMVIGIGSGIIIVSIIVRIVFLWLSSRGNFMFLSCVAQNKAEVKLPWHKYRQEGNSLFLFRLVVSVIGFLVFIILAGIVGGLIFTFRKNGMEMTVMLVGGLTALGVVILPVGLLFSVFIKSIFDFVVPIMYLHKITCTQAWGRYWELLKNNLGKFLLYFLFQIVITLAIYVISLMVWVVVSFCTFLILCCCVCCITNIPIIGTTGLLYLTAILILPLLIFARSYSLCYLRQYGSDFDAYPAVKILPETIGEQ